MPSCSKAPRGLFVLPRVGRIFTANSISPGPSSRQCPDRYAFRAGRNLPDKEFRYLRTVIVTAAVHRGFGSKLSPLPLTFRHWAGVSPYTSAFALAETCGFGKQSPGPAHCGPLPLAGQAGSRSRAILLPKLRIQFAEFLNEGSPVRLTVLTATYQCRFAVRARRRLAARLFSPAWAQSRRFDECLHFSRILSLPRRRISLPPDAYDAETDHIHWARGVYPPGSPLCVQTSPSWCWNTNQLSIAYASRPRLRPD